ncbi:hypothetical protein Tco_0873142 [Tanacetum coccineum]
MKNCCVSTAFIKQPSAYYYEYLREFWYSAEVDVTNTITFTLSNFDKPLSFNLDDFSSITRLKYSENYVSIPPKEMMRARFATLGLVDEKYSTLSSIDLVNSSPLKNRYFSPIWRVLMLHIVKYLGDLISKLINGKKKRELNVCYTRYVSLVIEHLLGNAYKNDKLKTFKPHHISATSFKIPSANEVALISHMLKEATISTMPKETLILPSKGVNTSNTADKSLSGTTVQLVGQSKASTDKKLKKNKNPSSSNPNTSKTIRESQPKKQVAETQHAEVLVAIADAIKSLEASGSAEELRNHPKLANSEKSLHQGMIRSVKETIVEEVVKDFGITSLGNVTFEDLYGYDINMDTDESPFDNEFDIKFIGKVDPKKTNDADNTLFGSSND